MNARSPLFVVGAGRSGTTLVSRILAQSPGVYNGHEFRYIWNYGASRKDGDFRGAEPDTSPSIRYVRRFFAELAEREQKIILDKTPSNALRLPYVASAFPEARFIHVVRDGRANVYSRYVEWHGGRVPADGIAHAHKRKSTFRPMELLLSRWRLFNARRRIGAYPFGRLPALLRDNVFPLAALLLLNRPQRFGERTPGLDQVWKEQGVLKAAAYQWRDTVSEAICEGRRLAGDRYLEIRYEDVIKSSDRIVPALFRFAGLDGTEQALRYCSQNLKVDTLENWRGQYQAKELQEIEPIVRPIMEYLGYAWD